MSLISKTFGALSLLVAVSLTSVAAHAELNIAVLNTQRAIIECEEAKGMIEKIKADVERDENSVRTLGESIQKLQQKLQKDADTLGNSEKRRLQKEIEDKQIDYQFQVNKLQKEVQDRQQEIFAALAPKLDTVLKELIEKEKFDMILQRSEILYVKSSHDITRLVTESLNRKR